MEDSSATEITSSGLEFAVSCATDGLVELGTCTDGTALDDLHEAVHKIMKMLCFKNENRVETWFTQKPCH